MLIDEDRYLEHYGVMGMKWGIRNDNRPSGVSRSTNREASKDAKEFARARQFTGEGAGNRRKHIKSSVESKKKKSSSYTKAFDSALDRQDVSKHVSRAQSERKRKDRTLKTKQRAGSVVRRLTGEMGTQAAFVSAAFAGAAYLKTPSGQATKVKVIRTIKNQRNSRAYRETQAFVQDLFKRMQ